MTPTNPTAAPAVEEAIPPLPEPDAWIGSDRVDVGVGVTRDTVLRWDKRDEDDEPLFSKEAVRAILRASRSSSEVLLKQAEEALSDILNGWRYIRQSHGDLYGVGWDRAEGKADAALTALRSRKPARVRLLTDAEMRSLRAAYHEFGAMTWDEAIERAVLKANLGDNIVIEGAAP